MYCRNIGENDSKISKNRINSSFREFSMRMSSHRLSHNSYIQVSMVQGLFWDWFRE